MEHLAETPSILVKMSAYWEYRTTISRLFFRQTVVRLHPQPSEQELGQVERRFNEYIEYYDDNKLLSYKSRSEVFAIAKKAAMELDQTNSVEKILWDFFRVYLTINGGWFEREADYAEVYALYATVTLDDDSRRGARSPYALLEARYPGDPYMFQKWNISELTYVKALEALYNNFDVEIKRVRDIEAVFTEVFTKLRRNLGLEGELRRFFAYRLVSIVSDRGSGAEPGKIDFKTYERLNRLAYPSNEQEWEESRPQYELRPRENWLSEPLLYELVAAMIFGLLASYPLWS